MTTGKSLKIAGATQVLQNSANFTDDARKIFKKMRRKTFTGEDIRLFVTARGVSPKHHNAWGGFVMGLVRDGTISHTGEYTKSKDPRAHSAEIRVYALSH